jgi:bifunctional non-homologous end joining protein LigD
MGVRARLEAWHQEDVIGAVPDSVLALPLGLVEEREPHRTRVARPVSAAADLQLARGAPLPVKLVPQLATLASSVPFGSWVVESKFDGYRLLARIDGREVRLFTRNGHDWTDKLAPIAQAIADMGLDSAWLDGEIEVLNDAGLSAFNRLRNAIDNARSQDIEMFVFDVSHLGGRDLREMPLASRRLVLQQLFEGRGESTVRLSQSFDVMPGHLLEAACQMCMEAVMVNRADELYPAGRSKAAS